MTVDPEFSVCFQFPCCLNSTLVKADHSSQGPVDPGHGVMALLVLAGQMDPALCRFGVRGTDYLWSLPGCLPGAPAALCAEPGVCVSRGLQHGQPAAHGGAGDSQGSLRCHCPWGQGKACGRSSSLQTVSDGSVTVFCKSPACLNFRPQAYLTGKDERMWNIWDESFMRWPQGVLPPADVSYCLGMKAL